MVTAVLVKHPRGDLLIDTGLGRQIDQQLESIPLSVRKRGTFLGVVRIPVSPCRRRSPVSDCYTAAVSCMKARHLGNALTTGESKGAPSRTTIMNTCRRSDCATAARRRRPPHRVAVASREHYDRNGVVADRHVPERLVIAAP